MSKRNSYVEMLRVLAIAGISVFHVFQPWFAATAVATPIDQLSPENQVIASNPLAMLLLGLIALLGATGNHMFYMISGFYLVPSAARKSHTMTSAEYWREQFAATARRALIIVLSVLFYIAVCYVINVFVTVPEIGTVVWWSYGLEFVWLYLVFVVIAPVFAWIVERANPRVLWTLMVIALVVVFALNLYIAFINPQDTARGLSDWRKQMSAVTYLVSFLFAGVVGVDVRKAGGLGRVSAQAWRRAATALALLVLLVEAVLVVLDERQLMMALSYKSTSLISFLGAWFALMIATAAHGNGEADVAHSARSMPENIARCITAVASGILGFYIAQSLLGGIWHTQCTAIMKGLLLQGNAWSLAAALTFGVLFALAFVLLVTIFDYVTRQPLLRLLRLRSITRA
ncbi:acyltransferase family protein [Bifidobacterium sp. LC6]|uniref:Acyltransferase family protein n=1 Tax=Bifidobacterium colobi TaxID=2809026 RepID=A0ABS5UXD5_9BIFI|nr:acyltransferase family protein [Bifidobacterium colobi]MBT1175785.1 acyltransferase family protein [Bifidobacterium colobi]